MVDNKKESVLYPVHGLEFNSRNPKFVCTVISNIYLNFLNKLSFEIFVLKKYFFYQQAGGDGTIHFWDYEAKNKIRSMSFKSQPVTSISISPDGNLLAYALGCNFFIFKKFFYFY